MVSWVHMASGKRAQTSCLKCRLVRISDVHCMLHWGLFRCFDLANNKISKDARATKEDPTVVKKEIQWMSEIRTSGFRRFRKLSGFPKLPVFRWNVWNLDINVWIPAIYVRISDILSENQTLCPVFGRLLLSIYLSIWKPDTIVSGLPNRTSGIRTSTVFMIQKKVL